MTREASAERELAFACERAREARPEFALAREGFLQHVNSKLRDAGERLQDLEVDDLYLAYACALGDKAALTEFEAGIIAQVPSFVRRLRLPASTVDEVTQVLRAKLLLPGTDDAPAKILGYSGRGRLASWVRVAAVRAGLDLHRAGANAGDLEEDADIVSPAADPEVEHLRARYGQQFERALGEAAAALTPRQRALLRMQHVDGLNGEQIGAVYGVNRSTVSRWLADAHDLLLDGVRGVLMKRDGLSSSEFESLARQLVSRLDVSIRVILSRE